MFKAHHLAGTLCLFAVVGWALRGALPFHASVADRLAAARELRTQGALERAEATLRDVHSGDQAEQSAVLGLLGRISMDRGDLEKAQRHLTAAFEKGRAAMLHEQAIDDALALAYLLSELRNDLASAASILRQAESLAQELPAARARLSYQQGLLAFNTGELSTALTLFRSAAEGAGDDARSRLFASEMEAFTLSSLGRFDAALTLIRSLAPLSGSSACEDADRSANRGFVAFLGFEALRDQVPKDAARLRDMRREFEQAAQASQRCGDPQRRKNAEVNLGLVALAESDAQRAREHLRAAQALEVEDRKLRAWELELEGRLLLLERNFAQAETTFRRADELARAAYDLAWSYRAQWGLGEALYGARQLDGAIRAFEVAEQSLNELLRSHAPLSLDQSAFLGGRDGALRSQVRTLLERGDVTSAHLVVRRAVARAQRQAAQVGGHAALSSAERERVQRELGVYRALRAQLDGQAREDWRKSARALDEARTQRKALEQRAVAALDRAYAQSPVAEAAAGPTRQGVLQLTYFPAQPEWLAFAATSEKVWAERVSEGSVADRTSKLLVPFADAIRRASVVSVQTYGDASRLDVHALSFDGRPLLQRVHVIYPLDGGAPQSGISDRSLSLVDPGEVFEAADAERTTVKRALATRGPVNSLSTPSRAQLMSELEKSAFFHFGGHAVSVPYDPLSSRLLLGKDGALSVADVLSLARAPKEVVLAACESGAPSSHTGPVGLSLAAAFVARGAQSVIATSRPVSNQSARRFVDAFYRGIEQGLTFSGAFVRAQRDLMQDAPQLDVGAFRLWTHATEYSYDRQIRCEACVAQREPALERFGLHTATR